MSYCQRLDQAQQDVEFDKKVRDLCAPYYVQDVALEGREWIDPYVYFKILPVGAFENIGSERGIAIRCADSISIRVFLKYDLTERTPDHSSLSRIRKRIGTGVYKEALKIILEILMRHQLLKGKQIGIVTLVIEANASMHTPVNRHTGAMYDAHVRRLAQAAGMDVKDHHAVRKFDRKQKDKKLSNADWHSPNDPDAKIGPTKQGALKMIHKTEHIVDLENGAIVHVHVLPGHQRDDQDFTGAGSNKGSTALYIQEIKKNNHHGRQGVFPD